MDIYFICPHCTGSFIINEKDLNCMIVRHAVFKHNMEPINPHASKQICDDLVQNNLVIGCAKPIQIIKKEKEYAAIECDYV